MTTAMPESPASLSPLVDGLSGDLVLECVMAQAIGEIFLLWKQRQKKYGSSNIAAFGETGCLVRGYDKMARLRQALINKKGLDADDESIEDSWKDLVNYSIMGLVCRRGLWPGVEQKS